MVRTAFSILVLVLVAAPSLLPAAAVPPPEQQIAAAVLAAPEDRRDGAGVLGYDGSGKLVELRARSNDLICLADDPGDDQFNVACYHHELEPYMARGRELRDQGVTGMKRNQMRWEEIEAGKLALPREPRSLYVLTGSSLDPATGEIADRYERWVLYTPFATPESTGLGTTPVDNEPWLMFPGTAGAHIMITPPRP